MKLLLQVCLLGQLELALTGLLELILLALMNLFGRLLLEVVSMVYPPEQSLDLSVHCQE